MKPSQQQVDLLRQGIADISVGDPADPAVRSAADAIWRVAPDFLTVADPTKINRFKVARAIGAELPFNIYGGRPSHMDKINTTRPVAEMLLDLCPWVTIRTPNYKDTPPVSNEAIFLHMEYFGTEQQFSEWDLTLASTRDLVRFVSLINDGSVKLDPSLEKCAIIGHDNYLIVNGGKVVSIMEATYGADNWPHSGMNPDKLVLTQLVKIVEK